MTDAFDAAPPSRTSAVARTVLERWASPALTNHCLRSAVFALELGRTEGLRFDAELLYCAAMLHDLGVTEQFDAASAPFEDAGGSVAWVFAAGAGWPAPACDRIRQVVQRHALAAVDPAVDPESYLLEAATSLDVAGSRPELWSRQTRETVVRRFPRLDFADEFDAAIARQASTKPASEAARFHAGDGVRRGERFWATVAAD